MLEPQSEELFAQRKNKIEIKLTKYTYFDDADLGWECDVYYEGLFIGGGTAPTIEGVYDMANEIIWDHENPSEW